MSFWTNPGKSISDAVNGVVQDISRIPQDVQTLVTNPAKFIDQTLSNPGASALAGAALTAVAPGLGALTDAAIVGGTEALATGNLQKGLMTGIGAYGGSNIATDALTAAANNGNASLLANGDTAGGLSDASLASTGNNLSAMGSTLLNNPGSILAAASPGGLGKDALALAGSVIQSGSGPNGNAVIGSTTNTGTGSTTNSGTSNTTSTGGGKITDPTGYTATPGGNPTGYYYNRNPVSAQNLNLIGANYTPGENVDTSERTYFSPTYSTTQGNPYTNYSNSDMASYAKDTGLNLNDQNAVAKAVATSNSNPAAVADFIASQNFAAQNSNSGPTLNYGDVSKSAMGGLQATPQAQMVNMPNPNAPMVHNLSDAYHRPFAQAPVPQPVMMASGGLPKGKATAESLRPTVATMHGVEHLMKFDDGGSTDPMDYGSDPVTNLPSAGVYSVDPRTHTPYSQDIGRENMSGNALLQLLAQEKAAQTAASQSIANDPNAAPSVTAARGGAMGISAYADGGGIYNLGGYSDGGRLLRGPGDGVSDSIPATIGHKQPARLADGEFVVPARIVSELGNGSTEAGARKLYSMLDRIQAARNKSVGKGKVAKDTKADKYLPA